MSIDLSRLDIHSADEFQKVLDLAGKTIECSWFIGAIRHHSDGRWVPVIMFADEDKKEFAYAFEIRGGGGEVEAFCSRLKAVGWKCDSSNKASGK